MPVIFFGHGNPMNAISDNAYSNAWSAIGKSIPRPKAVLAISAHWYVPGISVTANLNPRTIHDFGGFPKTLYDSQYPAPGSLELAQRVQQLLSPKKVNLDESWGLDHGTWSVLIHVFPDADIPIVQLSIDKTQPPSVHYEIGKMLSTLREEQVLIMGSGNIVHNLAQYDWNHPETKPFAWASQFEEQVISAISHGDDTALINYHELGSAAKLSVPTPEHYLPLLYILGLRKPVESVSFPVQGFEGGAISMLSVQIG